VKEALGMTEVPSNIPQDESAPKSGHRHAPPDMGEADVMPTEHAWELEQKSQLVEEIKESADKLARDDATRGDMKIISRAVKELRYAFKVFKPFRRQRKVTVFGSARTKPDHPAYIQAVELGKRLAEEGWMVVTGAGGGIMEAAHVGAGRETARTMPSPRRDRQRRAHPPTRRPRPGTTPPRHSDGAARQPG
jgi:hypothetical protein